MRDLLDRITQKIDFQDDGCWVWTATKTYGYGQIKVTTSRHAPAHRALYELVVDEIPPGMQIDHLCRNRACVNPDHLEVVTQAENWRRGQSVTRQHSQKTHCKHGHEFTEENTYRWKTGRHCRTCLRERAARVRKS